MAEWQLFEPGTVPECATPEWYTDRDRAPHIDEPIHQDRLHLAAQFVRDAARRGGYTTVVDLGAGDGGLLTLLPDAIAWGYDLQPTNIAGAEQRGVNVELGNVLEDSIEWGDIAVATEMIEHLVDPHGFVRMVRDNAKICVASSPWTETDESHYAFHLWAWDIFGYHELFTDAGWYVFAHEKAGMFQVLMAVRPDQFRRNQKAAA
jgi:hypothetical protein